MCQIVVMPRSMCDAGRACVMPFSRHFAATILPASSAACSDLGPAGRENAPRALACLRLGGVFFGSGWNFPGFEPQTSCI